MDISLLASQVNQAQELPYFSLCNMAVCALNVKSDLGQSAMYFSRKSPLACWLSNMLSIFSSQLLSNFLLNEPLVSSLTNTKQVYIATFIWYLIYYSPFDIVYRITQVTPIKLLIYCTNEVYITYQVMFGTRHASRVYPNSPIVMIFVGIARGNGANLMKLFESLTRRSWKSSFLEFLNPNYSTKAVIVTALLIITNDSHLGPHKQLKNLWSIGIFGKVSDQNVNINRQTSDHELPFEDINNGNLESSSTVAQAVAAEAALRYTIGDPEKLLLFIAVAAIYFKASEIVLEVNEPFAPIENLIKLMFFGGLWDAIANALAVEGQRASMRRRLLLQKQQQYQQMNHTQQTNPKTSSQLKTLYPQRIVRTTAAPVIHRQSQTLERQASLHQLQH